MQPAREAELVEVRAVVDAEHREEDRDDEARDERTPDAQERIHDVASPWDR